MKRIIIWGAALAWSACAANATEPKEYFALEIQALQLSVEASKAQLRCLDEEGPRCDTNRRLSIAETYQEKLLKLYRRAGTTPGEMMRYYMQHRRELDPLYRSGAYADQIKKLQEEIERLHHEITEEGGQE